MIEEQKNKQGEPEDIFEQVEQKKPSLPSMSQKTKDETAQEILTPKIEQKTPDKLIFVKSANKKPLNKKKIIRLMVVVIIVLVFGLSVFYVLNKMKGKNEPEIPYSLEKEEGLDMTTTPSVIPVITEKKILDLDGDGLTDDEENDFGTDKNNPDSDNDGLSDREEIKIYKTEPTKADTDQDGVSDGQEVKQGMDPKNPDPEAKLLDLQREIEKLR